MWNDIGPGLALVVFGIAVYTMIPWQIQEVRTYTAAAGLQPSFFARISSIIMVVMGAVIVLTSLIQWKKPEIKAPEQVSEPRLGHDRKRMVITLVTYFLYVFLMESVGFLVLTPFMTAYLMWVWGKPKTLYLTLAIAVASTAGVYLFFQETMSIYLPTGTLFGAN
jgi:hypothetical protein